MILTRSLDEDELRKTLLKLTMTFAQVMYSLIKCMCTHCIAESSSLPYKIISTNISVKIMKHWKYWPFRGFGRAIRSLSFTISFFWRHFPTAKHHHTLKWMTLSSPKGAQYTIWHRPQKFMPEVNTQILRIIKIITRPLLKILTFVYIYCTVKIQIFILYGRPTTVIKLHTSVLEL